MTEPEVIPADSPEAIRIAALLHPAVYRAALKHDPLQIEIEIDFAALAQLLDFELPEEPSWP